MDNEQSFEKLVFSFLNLVISTLAVSHAALAHQSMFISVSEYEEIVRTSPCWLK